MGIRILNGKDSVRLVLLFDSLVFVFAVYDFVCFRRVIGEFDVLHFLESVADLVYRCREFLGIGTECPYGFA